MGGGATMKAVSKVAGFTGGVVHAGIRGTTASAALPAEQAMRKSSIPVSAMLSSSSRGGADVAAMQRPAWESEGWGFAGGVEEDLVVAAGEPMPRVLFSGVPSLEEAKEATLELKDALDKVYLSSARELVATDQLSGLSPVDDHSLGLKTNVSSHAIKAFKLLSTSPEVQNVVASITSDQKVWKAVWNNPVLQEFMQSNENKVELQEPLLAEKSEDSTAKPEEAKNSGNWFTGMFKKVKLSTVNFVTRLSSMFNEIFGPSDVNGDDEKAGRKDSTLEKGTSLIGLVTMVVMVVLFKRI